MRHSKVITCALASLWLGAIGFGMPVLMNYENSPAKAAEPPATWPKVSSVPLSSDMATLIMFAHPQCPCTVASIVELSKLVSLDSVKVKPYILFLDPRSKPHHWDRDDSIKLAHAIPGAVILSDLDGVEAQRFHSLTSGHTVVYDVDGALLFSGGITGGRGQTGANQGRKSLLEALRNNSRNARTSHVYGCALSHCSD